MIEHVKFTVRTSSGSLIRKPLILERTGGRIYFWDEQMKKSPWGFKDEIKSMAGSHFHGYDDEGDYAKKMVIVEQASQFAAQNIIPAWLEANFENMSGRVLRLPKRVDVNLPINEQLIVELYSK